MAEAREARIPIKWPCDRLTIKFKKKKEGKKGRNKEGKREGRKERGKAAHVTRETFTIGAETEKLLIRF